LSNLADKRLARCSVAIPFERLATAAMSGEEVAQGIAAAYRFAYADPHRACTHNKGVMNGAAPPLRAQARARCRRADGKVVQACLSTAAC
jgi:hydroxymethylglutaryl-CoA reductase